MATEKHDSEDIVSKDKEMISTDNKISRRGLLSKAAIGLPVALTLAHKPAFGAICSASGFSSINPSGPGQTTGPGCGGFSPGGWRQNGFKTGNQDGNRNQWLQAGFNPNPRPGHSTDQPGTLFFASSAFAGCQTSPGVNIDPNDTLHDVMFNHSGSLEFHAVANLLNAYYFADYRLSPRDVVGLYDSYNRNLSTYTTDSGTTINMANFYATSNGLQDFFDQYH